MIRKRSATVVLGLVLVSCSSKQSTSSCHNIEEGALVITEFMPDPKGKESDTNEWIELFNATNKVIDPSGLKVVISTDIEGSPAKSKSFIIPDGVEVIEPKTYMVIGQWIQAAQPTWVKRSIGIGAAFPEMTTKGNIKLVCGEIVVDEVWYAFAKEGVSNNFGLDPSNNGTEVNDDYENKEVWCFSRSSFGEEKGTPGAENDPCAENVCKDGDKWVTFECPGGGSLVITEVMPSPSKVSDTLGEWFEVYVAKDVHLNGLEFGNAPDDPASKYKNKIEDLLCLTAKKGDILLFARNDDPEKNGGLPSVFSKFTFSLKGTDGALYIACGGNILDKVAWKNDPGDHSLSLDPDHYDPTANDDGSKWCKVNKKYGLGDYGTPGQINPQCP